MLLDNNTQKTSDAILSDLRRSITDCAIRTAQLKFKANDEENLERAISLRKIEDLLDEARLILHDVC